MMKSMKRVEHRKTAMSESKNNGGVKPQLTDDERRRLGRVYALLIELARERRITEEGVAAQDVGAAEESS